MTFYFLININIFFELKSIILEIDKIETAIIRLEAKYLMGEYSSESIYSNIKNELLSNHNNNRILLEQIQGELDKIERQNQWLQWIDELAVLIKDSTHIKSDKDTIDTVNSSDNSVIQYNFKHSNNVKYNNNNSYFHFPNTIIENLLSNTLESVSVGYNHKKKLHKLDIKLHLPVTANPESILKNNFHKYSTNTTIRSKNKSTPKHGNRGENYSTVTDLAKLRGWSTSHSSRSAMW